MKVYLIYFKEEWMKEAEKLVEKINVTEFKKVLGRVNGGLKNASK